MPPKPKITKDMVLEAAFAIARASGAEQINARTVAERLHCSTQPVMYHFATIEELKKTVYEKAEQYHTEFLMKSARSNENVLMEIGLNYIRFAVQEPHLFRFLFQSGYAVENSLPEMIDSDGLTPVISAMQEAMDMSLSQTKDIFVTLAMFVHGYASIIANNSFAYEEELIKLHLERVYTGAVFAAQAETAAKDSQR